MINSKHKDLYMKKIYTLAALAAMTMLGTSCNSEWEDEQYEHYISFSSQLDSKGVTNIYVPYSRHDAEGNYAEGGPIISYRYLLVVLPIIQVMSLYT